MRRLDRRRTRGSAAVEFLLSVPFLVLFCLLMLDFARGQLSAQRGQRAARHMAWTQSRHEEEPALPPAPTAEQLHALHYEGRGGTVAAGTDTQHSEALGGILGKDASEGIEAAAELIDLGRRFDEFVLCIFDMTHASVTQHVSDLQWFAQGAAMTQEHWVALRAYREEDPGRHVGWWDPFVLLGDLISGTEDG